MSNNLTILTDAHRQIITYLEKRGIELIEECPFFPYTTDCFLPDYHVAVEIDGPQHEKKRDAERDEELMNVYALPVFHIPAEQVKQTNKWETDLKDFLEVYETTAKERWESVRFRLPWL